MVPVHTGPEIPPVHADPPATVKTETAPKKAVPKPGAWLSESAVLQLIHEAPKAHLLTEGQDQQILETFKCESKLHTTARGDGGRSVGIAQIHLPSHPYISAAEAEDVVFAVNWTVAQFVKGNSDRWTCYRSLFTAADRP